MQDIGSSRTKASPMFIKCTARRKTERQAERKRETERETDRERERERKRERKMEDDSMRGENETKWMREKLEKEGE